MSILAGDHCSLPSIYITPLQFFICIHDIHSRCFTVHTHALTHTYTYIYTHCQRAAFIYKLKRNETKSKIMLNNLFLPAPLLFVKQLQQRLQQEVSLRVVSALNCLHIYLPIYLSTTTTIYYL